MKEKLLNLLEIGAFIAANVLFFVIWHEIRWLGVILLFFIAPLSLYAIYEFFREMHQSNLDDIQEQLNIVQDSWIQDISNKVRENWDLKTKKVVPYDGWNCRSIFSKMKMAMY